MSEIWKKYPDSEKYMISNTGRVKSSYGKKSKILKSRVDLYVNKKRFSWLLSELVQYVFDNKLNRSHKGSENPRAKLTEIQVKMIRERYNSESDNFHKYLKENNIEYIYKFTGKELCRFLNIHNRNLRAINNNEIWKHLL